MLHLRRARHAAPAANGALGNVARDALCTDLEPSAATIDVPPDPDVANAWFAGWCEGPVVLNLRTALHDGTPDGDIALTGTLTQQAAPSEIHLAVDGALQVTGEIPAFQCPEIGMDELVVTLHGIEVARMPSQGNVLLGQGATVPLPQGGAALLLLAGIPQSPASRQPLVFRHSSSCLANPRVIATVMVDFTPVDAGCFVCCNRLGDYCSCGQC